MKKNLIFLGFLYSIFYPCFAFSDEAGVVQGAPIQGAAEAADAANPSFMQALIQMLPLCIIMYLIFYFIVTKPQEKARKQLEKMVNELKRGEEVLTTSGICGKVLSIDGDFVHIEVAKGVGIKFSKQSIIRKL